MTSSTVHTTQARGAAEEAPVVADHAYAGVTIGLMLCATSILTFTTLFS
ncbi:hypothetical protein [Gordonia sp. 'Campus']|nr:hypothetical protein [Gordonia sp. 'Campus']